MKTVNEIIEQQRLFNYQLGFDGGQGFIKILHGKKNFAVIFSFGCEWDHVSVSLKHRTPTWKEMCIVKDIFFNESENVIQYHPAKESYKNTHKNCLHLWKPQKIELPKPPNCMI